MTGGSRKGILRHAVVEPTSSDNNEENEVDGRAAAAGTTEKRHVPSVPEV